MGAVSRPMVSLGAGMKAIEEVLGANVRIAGQSVQMLYYHHSQEQTLRDACALINSFNPGCLSVVIDVGAACGFVSVLAAAVGARVWAIEPNLRMLLLLQKNVQMNGLEDRVTIIPVAVYPEPGRLLALRTWWMKDVLMEQSSLVFHDLRSDVANYCATVRLEELLRLVGEPVDLLKIDIEGSEHLVLADLHPDAFADVRRIHLEVHDTTNENYFEIATPKIDPADLLRRAGFEHGGSNEMWVRPSVIEESLHASML